MPKAARLLKFPVRQVAVVRSPEELGILANQFLCSGPEGRGAGDWECMENPDVMLFVLESLKKLVNSEPERVEREASSIYEHLKSVAGIGLFDERDYFLGESALAAGIACRLTGRYDDAERWFDLADISFRHTINSTPLLTRVSHARLVLRYDMRRYAHVLALLPSVKAEYERLGMTTDLNKARFLEGLALKETGRADESFACMLALRASFSLDEPTFRSFVLTNIAEEYARREQPEKALEVYHEAFVAASASQDEMSSAQLKGSIGEVYRAQGDYGQAIDCFRSAIGGFASLGMQTRVAFLRVILAEALLAAERDREAEWEILAALPIIQEQHMVVEGFAAIELLKRSVAQKKIDRDALGRLRLQIQKS